MKKPFTKSLTVIFAVLGVYFVAFKVLVKVEVSDSIHNDPRQTEYYVSYVARWSSLNWTEREMRTCFAPLILMEKQIRGMDEWEDSGLVPEPDWVKEYRSKP